MKDSAKGSWIINNWSYSKAGIENVDGLHWNLSKRAYAESFKMDWLQKVDEYVQVVKQDTGPHTPVKRKWTDGNVGAAPAVAVGGSSSEGGQAPAPLTAPAEAEAEAEAEEGLPEGNGEEEEVAAGLILLEPK
eukprot:7138950-Lingulodinium_polyedra.AAC.1